MEQTPQEKENIRRVIALVTARAWKDDAFKQRYLSDPKSILSQEGIELPANLDVKVLEDTETVKNIVVSSGSDPEQHAEQFARFNRLLTSVLKKHEARVVQQTETMQYVVLPTAPAGSTTASGQVAAAAAPTSEAEPPSEVAVVASSQLLIMDACFTVVCESTQEAIVETSVNIVMS